MRQNHAALLAVFVAIGFVLSVQAQATYHVTRTAWGDPDLEGKWPSTRMNAVPLQRPESLGTRDTLNDKEFAERATQLARQKDQDLEDFDIAHPSVPFGVVGG